MADLPLAVRIHQYLATLAPHMREREAAMLLAEAEDELDRISEREFVSQAMATIMGGWIAVSERLPETPDEVLAFVGGIIDIACYVEGVWSWSAMLGNNEPTYWMPLPEPPDAT